MPEVPSNRLSDGQVEASFWNQVKPFYLVPKNGTDNEEIKQPTICRAAWDRENFYFHIRAVEQNTVEMRAPVRTKDTPEIWQDNCLELFLASSKDAGEGYQFIINSAGSISDNRFVSGYTDWQWDSDAKFITRVEPGKYWDLEIRIPRKNLKMISGDSIAVNICRHRVVSGEKNSYDTWSPFVTGSNHMIAQFGILFFHAPAETNLLDTPDFDQPVRGKRFIGKWFAGKILPVDTRIFRTAGVSAVLNEQNDSISQYLPQLKSNTKYRLSYYIKIRDVKPLTEQDSGVYIRMELANGKPIILPGPRQEYKGTIPWTRQSFEFKTPEIRTRDKDNYVYVRFTKHANLASGTAWIDNVKLEEIP